MAKHAKQLRYSYGAISQAFHFLCIYSKDKEQLRQQAVHTSAGHTAALSNRLYSFQLKNINQPALFLFLRFEKEKAKLGLKSCGQRLTTETRRSLCASEQTLVWFSCGENVNRPHSLLTAESTVRFQTSQLPWAVICITE